MDSIRTLFPAVGTYSDQREALTEQIEGVRADAAAAYAKMGKAEVVAKAKAVWGREVTADTSKAAAIEDLSYRDAHDLSNQGRELLRLSKEAEGSFAHLTSLFFEIRSTRDSLLRAANRLVADTQGMLESLSNHAFVKEPNISKDSSDVEKYSALLNYQASTAKNMVHGNTYLVRLIADAVAQDMPVFISLDRLVTALREEEAANAGDLTDEQVQSLTPEHRAEYIRSHIG
jgi:hypothetical protein